jgi:hypothetical protein
MAGVCIAGELCFCRTIVYHDSGYTDIMPNVQRHAEAGIRSILTMEKQGQGWGITLLYKRPSYASAI